MTQKLSCLLIVESIPATPNGSPHTQKREYSTIWKKEERMEVFYMWVLRRGYENHWWKWRLSPYICIPVKTYFLFLIKTIEVILHRDGHLSTCRSFRWYKCCEQWYPYTPSTLLYFLSTFIRGLLSLPFLGFMGPRIKGWEQLLSPSHLKTHS